MIPMGAKKKLFNEVMTRVKANDTYEFKKRVAEERRRKRLVKKQKKHTRKVR